MSKFKKPWTDSDELSSESATLSHGEDSSICPKCTYKMTRCSLSKDSDGLDGFFCQSCKVTLPADA